MAATRSIILRASSLNSLSRVSGSNYISARPASSDLKKIEDIPIHTGQKWDSDDKRLVRFLNTPKQVNTRYAIDLIAQVPPKEVEQRVVWCNGGGGALGHPKVYINLDKAGPKACGYCGLRFVKKDDHHH
uniref:EOG090X0NBY n=1 Tax=Lynceus sp. MCZ IZ 141354 TaxID=1930659 RepID=A0A9N6WRU1_9CRUS|nr:EOG090X0NBY [Lynceus sp. MCZ IZ 141354]